MTLPDNVLKEITGYDGIRTERWAPESRQSPRVPLSVRAAFMPIREGKTGPALPVRVRDISATGIGILHKQSLQPADEFVVALPRKKGKPILIHCRVVRCQRVDTEMMLIGAIFLAVRESAPGLSQDTADELLRTGRRESGE